MSQFSEKIFSGATPSFADWVNHLTEAHARAPSMTPVTFGEYRTPDGRNSYQYFLDAIALPPRKTTVLDLACGNGALLPYLLPRLSPDSRVIGIDMSPEELAVARTNIHDPRVRFAQGMAQQLPLPDGTVDIVLCHLALMLMTPLDPVIAELARVVTPHGAVHALIFNRSQLAHVNPLFPVAIRWLQARYPALQQHFTEEERLLSPEGLRTTFSATLGFATPRTTDIVLTRTITPAAIAEHFQHFYLIAMLPPAERTELLHALTAHATQIANPDGTLTLGWPFTIVSVKHCAPTD